MKLRNKVVATVLTGLLALSAAACGGGAGDGGTATEPGGEASPPAEAGS